MTIPWQLTRIHFEEFVELVDLYDVEEHHDVQLQVTGTV